MAANREQFFVKVPVVPLTPTERDSFARALGVSASDSGIDDVEEAIRHARLDVARGIDSYHTATQEGADELERLEDSAAALLVALQRTTDEAMGFLGVAAHDAALHSVAAAVAPLRRQLAEARRNHGERMRIEKRSAGAYPKLAARRLALRLAEIWEPRRSGWSHRHGWGHFVRLAFELAGIDASPVTISRWAAKEHRRPQTQSSAPRSGANSRESA